jgi:predicted helicase
MTPTPIKPTHKAIQKYHATLAEYHAGQVEHEGALRTAFGNLLADTCRAHHWLLIPEEPTKVGGKTVRPDGTLRDQFNLHRGFWEAKDEADDLSVEIKKKADKGYPLTNTIFEDTKRAVLFQGKESVFEADLTNKQQVADLLNQFYAYHEPEHQDFEQAVEAFQEDVPRLAQGLAKRIADAHKDNPKFQTAFDAFFALCQTALNPNISRAAVDEMLVQHLLTERLIRTIFDQDDFTKKNVIAAEVEKVVNALVSKSFSRAEFLKKLDRFYVAIENAARTMPEFTDKQHFLNTVYEGFTDSAQ